MAVTGRKLFLNFYQMVRSHNEGYLLWVWVNTECGREGDPGSMKNINQQIIYVMYVKYNRETSE